LDISIGLAFLAGMASFLTPCVLSLVPAYVGYLSGRSLEGNQPQPSSQLMETMLHGLAFVLGFSLVFIILGLAATALSNLLYDIKPLLSKIGGIVVIVLGLHMTGILRIKYLEYDLRPLSGVQKGRSLFSSFTMGIFFSSGWSPCIGPVLSSILTQAFIEGSSFEGIKMLSAYSAGLAIPFMVTAAGVGWVTRLIQKYRNISHYVEIIMGITLIIVGSMLFLGTFAELKRFGILVDFGI
jgi:cytochrome c-type biogenesis protein